MKRGDLVKVTRTSRAGIRSSSSRILGVLLEEPRFPTYGTFPKNYKVLTLQGTVEIVSDQHRFLIEAVE